MERRVPLGEAHALPRELVEVRRRDGGVAVAAEVAVALLVVVVGSGDV